MAVASILRVLSVAAVTSSCVGVKVKRQEPADGSAASSVRKGKAIWVHAYARSGSSTALSMVSQAFAGEPSTDQDFLNHIGRSASEIGRVFTLFEPCHMADKVDEELAPQGCQGLVLSLARCEFHHIYDLHGWVDPHSRTRGVGEYNPEQASEACKGADVVAFKTISRAGEVFDFETQGMPVLTAEPELKMLDIVRDPRDIFASWMSTWPFNDTSLKSGVQRNASALLELCESFAASDVANHSRSKRVVFEHLVKEPLRVMQSVYAFMGVPFGQAQREWVNETFDAQDCPGVNQFIAPYSDCHTNASASLEKWRSVLFEEEKKAFRENPACQHVAAVYGYNLE